MGVFIWHEWARYVNIFAAVYTSWAGVWGIFFRKFFWDFVNGGNMLARPESTVEVPVDCADTLPCGIIPAPQDQIFINIIVNAPIVQILAVIFGLVHLIIELAPPIKKMSIYRSFPLKIVTLLIQGFLAVLFYQGTNGAIYSLTAAVGYGIALAKGEEMKEAKDNRGRTGKA